MPFKSEKQRRYLYANNPELAKKWSSMYGDKITGLGGLSTDEYLMRIAATLLAKGLSPSKFTKTKAKSLTKGLKARKKVHELIDKYPADITIYMKRIKNL